MTTIGPESAANSHRPYVLHAPPEKDPMTDDLDPGDQISSTDL